MDVPNSGAIFTLGKSYLAENTQSYFYIKNDPIKRLISGPQQSAVICESGRLFVWGENHYGQLGIGSNAANNKTTDNSNNNNNNTSQNGDIITKPTCVKSLKTLGLKIADIAYGIHWAVILTHSNELFFTGHNIFADAANVNRNFMETTIANEQCFIIRKPFRLEEFDEALSNNEEIENFITVLAGNEHFAVMTSFGRLIGWGSNSNHQLGANDHNANGTMISPREIKLDAPVQQFACGPESTLVLTESGNLFLTGRLNDLVFSEFVILQKNLSSAEQIIFMHISKASEVFIVTNAGSIYRSSESLRNKSLIFQRFYDYDSEENGPIWKLLKGSSFYAVLTKANKFYTTFSESGHHLKTFREISKFKNLRLLDMAVGDQHILVHGIPRSSTLSATVGPGGEHRFMSRTYIMSNQMTNGNGNAGGEISTGAGGSAGRRSAARKTIEQTEHNKINGAKDDQRQETPKPNTPVKDHTTTNESPAKVASVENEIPPMAEGVHKTNFDVNEATSITTNGNASQSELDEKGIENKAFKSPAESVKSRRSAHSIKFDPAALQKDTPPSEKLLRPRTPYPESSANSTPQTIKKTPLRNYSYEAAMSNDYLEHTSPPMGASLENIPESVGSENVTAPITAIVSSPTPPSEEDEQLTVEINTTTNALDNTVVVNEIRFINNGIDVTANMQQNAMEMESAGSEDDVMDEEDEGSSVKASISKQFNEKTAEARRKAEGMLDELEQEIVEKVDQAVELKSEVQTQGAKVINNVENKLEETSDSVETKTKSMAREVVDAVEENAKRVANDTRQAVENMGHGAGRVVENMGHGAGKIASDTRQAVEHMGHGAAKIASDAKHAVDNAFSKMATETKEAVGSVTTKISSEMQEAKNNLTTFLSPKVTTRLETNDGDVEDELGSQAEEGLVGFKEGTGDDERTTASVNSNQTSSAGGGNPFESNNPFESGNPFEDDNVNDLNDGLQKGKQMLHDQLQATEHVVTEQGCMRQFLDDVRRGITCRNEKSIRIDDEPPRYSVSEELSSGGNRNGNMIGVTANQNTSKVCTIL